MNRGVLLHARGPVARLDMPQRYAVGAFPDKDTDVQECTIHSPRTACGQWKARMRSAASRPKCVNFGTKGLSCVGNAWISD